MALVNEPLITIILDEFNNFKALKKSLQSCSQQTYQNLQILIIANQWQISHWKLKKIQKTDNRIEVILKNSQFNLIEQKWNELNFVKGKFVFYLHVPDFLDFDFIRHNYFYACFHGADVVVNQFAYLFQKSYFIDKKYTCLKSVYQNHEVLDFFVDATYLNSVKAGLFNKFFKLTTLKHGLNHLRQCLITVDFQDIWWQNLFSFFVLSKAHKIVIDFKYHGIYHASASDFLTKNLLETKTITWIIKTIDLLVKQIFDFHTTNNFVNFYYTMIHSISMFLYLNHVQIQNKQLQQLQQIFQKLKKNVSEIAAEIQKTNTDWFLPQLIPFKNYTSIYKKEICIATNISFSLTNGIFTIPFLDVYDQNVNIPYASLNYEVFDCLLLTLYLNKTAKIAYDKRITLSQSLISNLQTVLQQLQLNMHNVEYFEVYNTVLSEFNILIDQLRVTEFSIFEIYEFSKIKKILKGSIFAEHNLEAWNWLRRLFFLSITVTRNEFVFYKKSITNYSFTMFFCFFFSLCLKTCTVFDISNPVGKFFFEIFQKKQLTNHNPIWNLNLQIATYTANHFLQIVHEVFPELLNKKYILTLFELLFQKLGSWYEFSTFLPREIINQNQKVNILLKWQYNQKFKHEFKSYRKGERKKNLCLRYFNRWKK